MIFAADLNAPNKPKTVYQKMVCLAAKTSSEVHAKIQGITSVHPKQQLEIFAYLEYEYGPKDDRRLFYSVMNCGSLPIESASYDIEQIQLINDGATCNVNVHLNTKTEETKSVNNNNKTEIDAPGPIIQVEQAPVSIPTTTIQVRCDVGLGNSLSLCGTGPGMTWTLGLPMQNKGADLWTCEIKSDKFKNFEFKIVRNNKDYEIGLNRTIECGKSLEFAPKFN